MSPQVPALILPFMKAENGINFSQKFTLVNEATGQVRWFTREKSGVHEGQFENVFLSSSVFEAHGKLWKTNQPDSPTQASYRRLSCSDLKVREG